MVGGMIPMQRIGSKSDIANAAVFLFSDAANWITGQIIVRSPDRRSADMQAVDGGHMHFRGPWLPYPDSSLDPKSFKSLFPGSKL